MDEALEQTCHVCGSSVAFNKADDGFFYCGYCHSQAEDIFETGVDQEQFFNINSSTDALLNASRAGSANSRFDFARGRSVPYAAVVKCTPGHPWEHPPVVPDVNFSPAYRVNDRPPANLVPLNCDELQRMAVADDVDAARKRLRAIYWFYNDPSLAVDDDANRIECFDAFQALDFFLKY